MIRLAAIALVLFSTAAWAQQPEPAFQKALNVLQQQRNAALNAQAECQVQALMQADEIAQLKARIADLEKAVPKPDPEK